MKKSYVDPSEVPELELASLRRVAQVLAPYRVHLAGVVACIALSAGLNLIPALLVKRVIDVAIPARDVAQVVLLSLAMIAGPLAAGLVNVGQKYLATLIAERVIVRSRTGGG